MAKRSSVILIGFSLAHAYNFRENIVIATSLLFGALVLVFLSIKGFQQKNVFVNLFGCEHLKI